MSEMRLALTIISRNTEWLATRDTHIIKKISHHTWNGPAIERPDENFSTATRLCTWTFKAVCNNYISIFEADIFSEETATQEKLMESITLEQSKIWNALTMDISNNKAWATIHKLHGDPKGAPQHPKVTANQVAYQLLEMERVEREGK